MATNTTCLPEVPNTFEFWAPLVVAIVGLPLCGAFLYESIRRYSSVMFPSTHTAKAGVHAALSLDRGKPQESHSSSVGASSSSSSTTPISSSNAGTGSADRNTLPRKQHQQQHQQVDKLTAVVLKRRYQHLKRMWPKSTNQLLVSCSLLCWITLLLDQTFVVGHMYSVSVLCPEWACLNATPTTTPGCPASTFIRAVPALNSLGLFFYAYGAIHRFSRVYSTMSPLRHRVIQAFSALATVLLIVRLASVSMLSHVAVMPNSLATPDSSRVQAGIAQIAGPIYTLVYSLFFTVLLIVDVGSTAISLHFVLDCRAQLNALTLEASKSAPQTTNPSLAVAVAMDPEKDAPTNPGPLLPLLPAQALPESPTSSSRRGSDRRASFSISIPESPLLLLSSAKRKSLATPLPTIPRSSSSLTTTGATSTTHTTLERNRPSGRNHMRAAVSRVLALMSIKVSVFALFALVRFTPLLTGRLSARLADAVVTFLLKLFIAAATQGIFTMTRLVALRH